MDRETVKQYMAMLKAFANGERIQVLTRGLYTGEEWRDVDEISLEYPPALYRIAPKDE